MDDWITLARLVRPRGIRGELLAEYYGNRRERLSSLREVTVFPGGSPEGESRNLEIESAWWHQERLILKFQGIDTMSDAEPLRGAVVCVPGSQRGEPPAGEYFQDDLLGCEVIDRTTGSCLGRIEGWQDYGGPPLLVVAGPEGELLIPFAASICVSIEPERRRVVVDLPAGLQDVNRP